MNKGLFKPGTRRTFNPRLQLPPGNIFLYLNHGSDRFLRIFLHICRRFQPSKRLGINQVFGESQGGELAALGVKTALALRLELPKIAV
jgi:hypothetical protein